MSDNGSPVPEDQPEDSRRHPDGKTLGLAELQLLVDALCAVKGVTRGEAVVISGPQPNTLLIIIREISE